MNFTYAKKNYESGYFAVNGLFRMQVILPSPFMSVLPNHICFNSTSDAVV